MQNTIAQLSQCELDAINAQGRAAFAATNRWMETKPFTIQSLARNQRRRHFSYTWFYGCGCDKDIIDHEEYYRTCGRLWGPICVISHVHMSLEHARKACVSWATDHSLLAHLLDDSSAGWYVPGQSITIAFTRPDAQVVWPACPR